jgi:hypothetical protein
MKIDLMKAYDSID